MIWTTIAWSMIASACLTLALIHLLIWLQQRGQWVHLLFSVTAIGAAAIAGCELLLMRADTVAEYAIVHRWAHVPTFVLVVGIVWFVRLYFGSGRIWLAWTVCGLRGLALVVNFLSPQSLNYTAITGLRKVAFLGGETVSVAQGVTSPWIHIGELSSLLLVVFVVDASLALWRRGAEGDRRRALVIGGSITFWVILAAGHGALVHRDLVHSPYLISVAFLAIVAAMAYELGSDAVRATRLAQRLQASEAELRASEQRLSLAADAAQFGMWVWDASEDKVWATDRLRTLLGFRPDEAITLPSFVDRVDPGDREAVRRALQRAVRDGADYVDEFRVRRPDGNLRWIAARGRSQRYASGTGIRMLGACIDITDRRRGEEAAHDLSGRLIRAQEAERQRLARELHDGLGQSLALLSVELEMLGQRPPGDTAETIARVHALSEQAKSLASEVHRLSYELHPAKLNQLGLVAAVRGLSRDLAMAYGFTIDFEDDEVPRVLPQALTLCLYRIAQEALQNVVKHSGAKRAKVEIKADGEALRLAVSDDGCGFDLQTSRDKESLGLVSMHERARLLRGHISIESRPGAGTRLDACIPLASTTALQSGAAG